MGNRYGIIGMAIALIITILAAVLGVETADGAAVRPRAPASSGSR